MLPCFQPCLQVQISAPGDCVSTPISAGLACLLDNTHRSNDAHCLLLRVALLEEPDRADLRHMQQPPSMLVLASSCATLSNRESRGSSKGSGPSDRPPLSKQYSRLSRKSISNSGVLHHLVGRADDAIVDCWVLVATSPFASSCQLYRIRAHVQPTVSSSGWGMLSPALDYPARGNAM